MSCTVNKVLLEDGTTESQLFKDLSESMAPGLALETYLELNSNKDKYKKIYGENSVGEVDGKNYVGTAKYKLANFDSYRQQKDVMDMLTEQFIEVLKLQPETKSDTTLSGLNLDGLSSNKILVKTAVQDIKDRILYAVENSKMPKRTKELYLDAVENLENYIFTVKSYTDENGNTIISPELGPVGEALQARGIFINTTEKQVDPESTDEQDDSFDTTDYEQKKIETARIYDLSILETNPTNSILDQLKVYLRGIKKVDPNYKWSENTDVKYEMSEVFQERLSNPFSLYSKLRGALKEIQDVSEIEPRLREAIEVSPELIPIYQDLVSGKHIKSVNGIKYDALETALFSLSAQDYNMFSVIESEDGNVIVMDANSKSIKRKVASRWEYEIAQIKKVGNPKEIVSKIDEFLKSKKVATDLVRKDKNGRYAPFITDLNKAANLFRQAGFTGVTGGVLKYIVEQSIDNKKIFSDDNVLNLNPKVTVFTLLKKVARKSMLSNQDIFSKEWTKSERKSIRILSEAVGKTQSDLTSEAFLSDKNTLTYPLNTGSAAQDTFTLLSSNTELGRDYLQSFAQDPMYTNTKLMSIFNKEDGGKDLGMFEFRTLSTLTNNTLSAAVDYGGLSTFDALIMRMNMFFSPGTKATHFNALTPTQADRGNLAAMTVPKFNLNPGSVEGASAGKVFDNNEIIAQDVKNWVEEQLRGEVSRIANLYKQKDIKTYSDRGKEFTLFPELNGKVDLSLLTSEQSSIDSVTEQLRPFAEQAFIDAIKNDIEFYKENQVIIDVPGDAYAIPKDFKSRYTNTLSENKVNKTEFENFIANNFIYNYESTLFIAGDPAFYKSNVDLNKRFALPFTPGRKFAVGKRNGINDTYKVLVLKEPKVKSELADLYKEITGVSDKYTDIELADGWGIASMDRFRKLNLAQGTHTDASIKAINDIANNRTPKTNDQIGSKKLFYFKLQATEGGVMVPMSQKYSLFPANPAMFEAKDSSGKYKFPALAKISQTLNRKTNRKVDEIVMESAFKTGAYNITTLDKIADTEPMYLHNNFVREVQVVPNKEKTEDLLGSQMRKLITTNFVNDGTLILNGEEVRGKDALMMYNKSLDAVIDYNLNEANDHVIPGGKASSEHLARQYMTSSKALEHRNTAYITEALGTTTKDGDRVLPVNYPTLSFKIDNYINSTYRKAINRLKLPGHSAVQIPSYGTFKTEDESLQQKSDLDFVKIKIRGGKVLEGADAIEVAKKIRKLSQTTDEKEAAQLAEELNKYEVTPAQVRVTPMYFLASIKKISNNLAASNSELIEEAKKFTRFGKDREAKRRLYNTKRDQLIPRYQELEYNRLLRQIKTNGQFDMAKIKELGLDEIVLYRIPTQGKSSMLKASIVEFLPENVGNTIQVPPEIVDQAGSDFDIDKVFIEMSGISYKKGKLQKQTYDQNQTSFTKEEAQAAIFDFHKSVLSSPHYMADLLMPNDITRLKEVARELGLQEDVEGGNLASARLQETFRVNNEAGSNLISVSSIAAVMHSVAQQIKPEFNRDISINGTPLELGRKFNIDGTDLISTEILELQNAAVDNARDPILGKLNINLFTSSPALFLVSAGHGLKFAASVLNAQVIKDLSQVYQKYSRLYSEKTALKKAVFEIRRKRKQPIPPGLGKKLFNQNTYSPQTAEAIVKAGKNASLEQNAMALEAFLHFKNYGDVLSRFQRVMNVDSKGTPASTAGLISLYQSLAEIPGTRSHDYAKAKGELGRADEGKVRISVNKERYNESHLAKMEEGSILGALKANVLISPAASKHFQRIIKRATKDFGYLPENAQLKLLNTYNTFMAMNSSALKGTFTKLSKKIEKGEFMYLTETSDPNSTASILKAYRQAVTEGYLRKNDFVEMLNIEEVEGRSFVTFLNTSSQAIPGEIQEDFMHYYEDLMYSDNELERRLAKSLADYAIVHYGFSTSKNSFMEFIPPIAHREYMSAKESGEGVSIPELFQNLEGSYNDTTQSGESSIFNENLDSFLEMFAANNVDMLNVETYKSPKEFFEEFDINVNKNKYVKIFSQKLNRYKLFTISGFGALEEVLPRGIKNLAVEYHKGPSLFNPVAIDSQENVSESSKVSSINQKVIENISNRFENMYYDIVGRDVDINNFTFKTEADIDSFLNTVESRINDSKITDHNKQQIVFLFSIAKDTALSRYNSKRFDIGKSLDSLFKQAFNINSISGYLSEHDTSYLC